MSSSPAHRLNAHENAVLDALTDAARNEVTAGHADIDVEAAEGGAPTMLRLTPRRTEAAALTIQVDDEQQLTFYPGSSGMLYEMWSKDHGELIAAVYEAARAVIEGRYAEEVRLTASGELGKGKGVIVRPGSKSMRMRYSSLPTLGERGPWARREYRPYRKS